MDPVQVKRDFYGRLGIYGGLDVRTMLGRGLPREQLAEEIRRVMHALKPGGGYIFCTSHMVQPGTPLEEVEFAYQIAHDNAWYR
jgi:uroporphyrinogen-III decarboxylase